MIVKSDDEKKEVVARVQSRVEQGQPVVEAVRAEGIEHLSQYYQWKKLMKKKDKAQLEFPVAAKKPSLKRGPKPGFKRKKPEPYVEEIRTRPEPEPEASKMACIIGTPKDIGEVLRSMK